jgi:thymidylate synthase (FAD)
MLNRFSVKLIAATKPEQLVSTPEGLRTLTAEELVAYTARVSNPGNQANVETAPKLLNYLQDHKHWSPFEMVHVVVEIETSRAIAAQILRHRSFSFQEFSQRYQESSSAGYKSYDIRSQDAKNRQSSHDDMPEDWKQEFHDDQQKIWELASNLYDKWIKRNGAKECARFLLPLNTSTKLYVAGSLRSWIHYLEVRCAPETQLEHREIALAIREVLACRFGTVF